MSTNSEWTILEKLLLTQAVYKYGENMWFQVARVLKQHGLIQPQQRQSDFYSQKNCQFQYYLLVENLEAEKQLYRNNDLKNDMPPVVRIARQLYTQRVEEVKQNLKKDEEEFGRLAQEIESIKTGKWDQKLKEQLPVTHNDTQLDETADSAQVNDSSTSVPVITQLPQHVTGEINRMKRTSSETAIVMGGSMKRCRLDESKEEEKEESPNEDQVLSTAIAVVSDDSSTLREVDVPAESTTHNIAETDKHESQLDESLESITDNVVSEDQVMSDTNNKENVIKVEAIASNESLNQPAEQSIPISSLLTTDDAMETEQIPDTVKVIEPQSSEKEAQLPHPHDIPLSITQLPKISIPSHSLHRLEQSVSPLRVMTPDEEDFTSSETATPTSTSTFDKKRPTSLNDQRQKAWQKNINLLWQEIANHKNGTMFMNPIKKSYAPLYDKVVKQPLYLKTIKNRVRDGIVKTTAEFERDVVLMLTNSLMYNKEGTEMYLMALEMLDDVREQIRLFKSADGYSVSAWEESTQSQ